jgi:hypothetical protein
MNEEEPNAESPNRERREFDGRVEEKVEVLAEKEWFWLSQFVEAALALGGRWESKEAGVARAVCGQEERPGPDPLFDTEPAVGGLFEPKDDGGLAALAQEEWPWLDQPPEAHFVVGGRWESNEDRGLCPVAQEDGL